jgi:hypothetical protein
VLILARSEAITHVEAYAEYVLSGALVLFTLYALVCLALSRIFLN